MQTHDLMCDERLDCGGTISPVLNEKYELLGDETIGAGSFGKVYRARSRAEGSIVAVKKTELNAGDNGISVYTLREVPFLHRSRKSKPSAFRKRKTGALNAPFLPQVALLKNLIHPNVVRMQALPATPPQALHNPSSPFRPCACRSSWNAASRRRCISYSSI